MIFFKDKKDELEAVEDKSVREIIEALSFEIREPLNSICGIAEVLSKWIEADYDKQQILNYVELLKFSADKLQNTVDSWKDVKELGNETAEAKSIEDDYSVLKNLRILVVEDNSTNSMIITELLETYGSIVTKCGNGKEAIEKFTESISGTYDIILMDINMPEMDGYEATDKVRSSNHPQAKNIPIIATTVETSSENIQNALKAGMNSHVSKPYSLGKIVSAIKGVL